MLSNSIPIPGPPWPYLRTSGVNHLQKTISTSLNLLVCSAGKGKRIGTTVQPGSLNAISFNSNLLDRNPIIPVVQQCRAVFNPSIFAWHSNSTTKSVSTSTSTSFNQDYLLVADEKTVELWTIIKSTTKEIRFTRCVTVVSVSVPQSKSKKN